MVAVKPPDDSGVRTPPTVTFTEVSSATVPVTDTEVPFARKFGSGAVIVMVGAATSRPSMRALIRFPGALWTSTTSVFDEASVSVRVSEPTLALISLDESCTVPLSAIEALDAR